MHDIALLVLDDCDAASVLGPMDVFGAANSLWRRQIGNTPDPLFRLTLVSTDGTPVTSAAGVGLEPRHALADMPRVDALIVATPHFHSPRSLFRLAASLTPALAPIADLEQRGTVVTAACTATALLAETGLFNGRDATTSWWLAGAFRKRYPQVRLQPDRVLVEDGRIVTAGAGMAWQNLALHLLARFAGTDMAGLCARSLLIDTTRDSQAPYAHFGASETNRDPLVLKAQHWMQAHIRRPFRLDDLAEELAVSSRTLIRHFKQAVGETPSAYAQALRLERAKHLLGETPLGLDAIAEQVGYGDSSTLRRALRRATGLSPAQYRKQQRQAEQPAPPSAPGP